jgi:hypothetical protein
LYADRWLEDEQLLIRPLLREYKNMNMAVGWMLKFTFYFMENSWTIAFRQMKFCTLKDHEHNKFYLNHYFLWQSFSIWQYFKIMRLCSKKRRTTV